MYHFTPEELETVHSLWKGVPDDHVWTGWAATVENPGEVWIFRTRANWRRFRIVKQDGLFRLLDETAATVADAKSLKALLRLVEKVPGLKDPPP